MHRQPGQDPQQPRQPQPQPQFRPPQHGPGQHPHTPPHAYPHPGPPAYAGPRPQPPAQGRRWWPIILAVTISAVVLAAAVGAAAWFLLLKPEKITVEGSMLLRDNNLTNGEQCWGVGGYSDIQPGAQVTVTDEAGTVLAIGNLGAGTGTSTGCLFPFTVTVEGGRDFYGFEVSRRGVVRYTEADIRDGIELFLGN